MTPGSETPSPAVTHGRHCSCSACAREDWTRIDAPCGMHGLECPAVYAPLVTPSPVKLNEEQPVMATGLATLAVDIAAFLPMGHVSREQLKELYQQAERATARLAEVEPLLGDVRLLLTGHPDAPETHAARVRLLQQTGLATERGEDC